MKVKSNTKLYALDGKTCLTHDAGDLTVGVAIANALIQSKGDSIKAYELALKFHAGKEVEVDVADLKIVKEAIHLYPNYNALVKGQILIFLEKTK